MAQKTLDEIFGQTTKRKSLDEIFGQKQVQPTQQAQPPKIDTGRSAIADVGVGAGKELLGLGKGASSLGERLFSGVLQTVLPKSAEKVFGVEDAPNLGIFGQKRGGETEAEKAFRRFEESGGLQPGQLTKPVNTAQKVGFYGTQVAEALTPLGVEAGLAKAPRLFKGLAGAGLAGTEAAVREGELNKNVALSTALGGVAGPLFGGFARRLGAKPSAISEVTTQTPGLFTKTRERTAQRFMDSLIKPLIRDLKYLKNPSRGIIKEGIVFNSLEEGARKVGQRVNEIGAEIGQKLISPENSIKKIDLSDVLKPIDDAINVAKRSPRINSALIKRLQDTKADLLQLDDVTGKATRKMKKLTPQEAFDFKKDVDAVTKYTGTLSDDTITNKALQNIRRSVKNKLNEKIEGLTELNERYSDLITAKNVINYRDQITSRQNIFPLAAKLGNIGGIIAGTVTLNPVVIATALATTSLEKALSSPAFKTRLAQWIAKSSVKQRQELIKKAPEMMPLLKMIQDKLGTTLAPAAVAKVISQYQATPNQRRNDMQDIETLQ
jgi:hypothetical protein